MFRYVKHLWWSFSSKMLVAKNCYLLLQLFKGSIIDIWQIPLYVPEIIFPLSIYLEHYLECRISHFSMIISHVYGCPKAYWGPYQKSMTYLFLRNLVIKLDPKIFKTFRQFYLRICSLNTLKVLGMLRPWPSHPSVQLKLIKYYFTLIIMCPY